MAGQVKSKYGRFSKSGKNCIPPPASQNYELLVRVGGRAQGVVCIMFFVINSNYSIFLKNLSPLPLKKIFFFSRNSIWKRGAKNFFRDVILKNIHPCNCGKFYFMAIPCVCIGIFFVAYFLSFDSLRGRYYLLKPNSKHFLRLNIFVAYFVICSGRNPELNPQFGDNFIKCCLDSNCKKIKKISMNMRVLRFI